MRQETIVFWDVSDMSWPHANMLHPTPDSLPCQHSIFTGRMLFLLPDQQWQKQRMPELHKIVPKLCKAHYRNGPTIKKVKVAHTRLPSVGFWSWCRFLAVSLQVTWVLNPAVGCHYFPPGLQLPMQPLRVLLSFLPLGEQRHNGCEQFA